MANLRILVGTVVNVNQISLNYRGTHQMGGLC
jgi:hypothetical protein